jgi:pilus assembly protein CpaE
MLEIRAFALVSSEETGLSLKSCIETIQGLTLSYILIKDCQEILLALQQTPPHLLILEHAELPQEVDRLIESTSNTAAPDSFQTIGLILENTQTLSPQFFNRALDVTATFRYPDEHESLIAHLTKFCERKLTDGKQLRRSRGKLYSVFSAKGGAGATTVAANLAYETHRLMQEPVLLLDMDQIYSNIAMLLNLKPDHCLRELAWTNPDEVDDEVFRVLIEKHPEGFDLLFSTGNVLDEGDALPARLINKCLDFALANYSYVYVDLPSYVLDANHQLIAERSDKLFLVTTLDIPGLYRTRQYLNLAKRELDVDKLEIIVNRWDLQGSYGISNSDLEKELGLTVFAHLADDWKLNVKANSLGLMLSQVNAQTDLCNDLQKMVANLTDLGLGDLQPLKAPNTFGKFKSAGVGTGIMNAILKGFDINVVNKA